METQRDFQEFLDQEMGRAKEHFEQHKTLMSFQEFLDLFFKSPQKLSRNAAEYVYSMLHFYGIEEGQGPGGHQFGIFKKFKGPSGCYIVGQEMAHEQIFHILEQFKRQGRVDKLVLLHGPNGSSKSSTAFVLAEAMKAYSQEEEGAVYCFNWVFPSDKISQEGLMKDSGQKSIGFLSQEEIPPYRSFAYLKEDEISCRITSEIRENPLFLLPEDMRVKLYQKAVALLLGKKEEEIEVPKHVQKGGISSKNKKIYDTLLVAYQGDLKKIWAHIQVERFFYSAKYRVGISTVEPQMHVDAIDKQLTMERNLQNLPPVLQNIRIFEQSGELIDANRGFVEFSDLLKRPVDAFKYLLTTVESMNLNLSSGIIDLDLLIIASTNEKYLDAFKQSPDWSSFKGRMELVKVPYLLDSRLERKIYEEDLRILSQTKPVMPHVLDIISRWAVLTRLKACDPSKYGEPHRVLVSKLDPLAKLSLYEGRELPSLFSEEEKAHLLKMVRKIRREGQWGSAYEGRFGASPREMKMVLYFAALHEKRDAITPLGLLEELEKLISDKSVYEFLQFEIQGGFHDVSFFIKQLKSDFLEDFSNEFLKALRFFDEMQYEKAMDKYLRHVMALMNGEKVYSEVTREYLEPDTSFMNEMEILLAFEGSAEDFRHRMVQKMASWRVENPQETFCVKKVFKEDLEQMARSVYAQRKERIDAISQGMLTWQNEDYEKLEPSLKKACEEVFENMEKDEGYTRKCVWETLALLHQK